MIDRVDIGLNYDIMPREFELREWLLLAMTDGIGPISMQKLLRAFGSPGAARAASITQLAEILPASTAQNIKNIQAIEDNVTAACRWAKQESCHIITLADEHYPPALLNISTNDPPPILYVHGNVAALYDRPLIAIVGSRNASANGARNTEIFSCALSEAGINIVSGLAQGIDSAAHRGALRGKGQTVAVMGTGIDLIYPKQSRLLAMEIVKNGGSLVSDFPLGTSPLAANFPRRNRIISGLAKGCLVIEASMKSGSLITAQTANEQGREVFAVPGSINSPLYKGCHHLIKQGAKLVENVGDIFEELNIMAKTPAQEKTPPPKKGELLSYIDFEPTSLDDIAERSGLSAEILLPDLLTLEIKGKIAATQNGMYQRL